MLSDLVNRTSLVILTSSESNGRRLRPLDKTGFAKTSVTFANRQYQYNGGSNAYSGQYTIIHTNANGVELLIQFGTSTSSQATFEVWNAEQSVNNTDFAEHLHVDCEKHLKQGIDVDQYVDAVLDEMWRGQRYESADGTPHYYEIPKIHTRSGNPVVGRL